MLTPKNSTVILMSGPQSVLKETTHMNEADYELNFIDLTNNDARSHTATENVSLSIADFTNLDKDQQADALPFFQSQSVRSNQAILFFDKNNPSDLLPEIIEQATSVISPRENAEQVLELIESTLLHLKNTQSLKSDLENTLGAFGLLTEATFALRTLNEARALSVLLSSLYPQNKDLTLGLTELLINGIEHGNLEITFEEKGELLRLGKWQQEIERRQSLETYKHKTVKIDYVHRADRIEFTIEDEGDGFDTTRFLGNENAPNIATGGLTCFHGRGIKLASQICFDKLEYLGKGNKVRATVML